MNKVFLGLGSNLGDKIKNIRSTTQFFIWDNRFEKVEFSPLYISTPYGLTNQDNFLNGVISFYTDVDIHNLLNITKELEKRVGRTKKATWGPREIDIDILLYGKLVSDEEKLTIPHKDMLNRDFVLVPLLDLDLEIVDPVSKKKLKLFLSDLNDKYIIDRINFNIFEENSLICNQE